MVTYTIIILEGRHSSNSTWRNQIKTEGNAPRVDFAIASLAINNKSGDSIPPPTSKMAEAMRPPSTPPNNFSVRSPLTELDIDTLGPLPHWPRHPVDSTITVEEAEGGRRSEKVWTRFSEGETFWNRFWQSLFWHIFILVVALGSRDRDNVVVIVVE